MVHVFSHSPRAAARFAVLMAMLAILASSAVADQEAACRSLPLAGNLDSVNSAVWIDNHSRIVVTDPLGQRIVVLTRDGMVDRELELDGHPKPIAGLKVGNDYVQMVRGFGMRWFDRSLQKRGETTGLMATGSFLGTRQPGAYRLWVYNSAVAGESLFMYGAAAQPDDAQPTQGFFTLRLTPPNVTKAVPKAKLVLFYGQEDFYILGHPYVATIGDTAYFLLLDGYPELLRYDVSADGPVEHVRGFPGEDDPLPVFDAGLFRTRLEIYNEIETFNLVVGLFAQDGFLYSLHRSPGPGKGKTSWHLNKMSPPDPVENRVNLVGTINLPTEASHLTVLPGPEEWIVFEKSSVRDEGRGPQDVEKMWAIPNSLIKASEGCR